MNNDIALLKKEIETGFSNQGQENLELTNSDFSDYLTLIEKDE